MWIILAMALRESTFSPQAAIEALLYVLSRRGGEATVHELLKIRYFADKRHLELYGSNGSGDRYFAMEFGPVASGTYDLLKASAKQAKKVPQKFIDLALGAIDGSNYPNLKPLRDPNVEALPRSVVATLDYAIEQCRGWDFRKRVEESHDAAWESARARWAETGDMEMPIDSIAKTLPNGLEIIEHMTA